MLVTELFETCEEETLSIIEGSSYFNSTLNLILLVLKEVISMQVLMNIFNLLQGTPINAAS